MQRESVYDLAAAPPHIAARHGYDAHEFQIYVRGYYMALAMALKVIDHAATRYELYVRTKRLERKRLKEQ